MSARRLSLVFLPVLLLLALPLSGAGSGTLWYRYSGVTDSWPTLLLANDGDLTITITALYTGTLTIDLLDQTGTSVFSHVLTFGTSPQSVTISSLRAGVYKLKAVGSFYINFRFSTSSSKFVMPGGMDFNPYHDGTYFFWVPPGTSAFDFRMVIPDAGESGNALIYAPDGSLRKEVVLAGIADQTYTIPVDAASRGAFWRVAFTSGWGDFRFYVSGVPNYFAESAEAWFDPDAAAAASGASIPTTSPLVAAALAMCLAAVALTCIRR